MPGISKKTITMYLNKKKILKLIEEKDLIIRPLLDKSKQVGEISIDLRLGTDFLVSFLGREPFIDVSGHPKSKPIKNFFGSTRRRFGETFLLHPNQTVLCSSLEYIKMPEDVFAVLNMRSSYARLGLTLATIVQAGYSGCFSIELTNVNHNPIRLRVGARIFHARFFKGDEMKYLSGDRKYICQVRPIVSKADIDTDLKILKTISGQEK